MQCRICRNEQGNRGFTAREMMLGTRDEFRYFECAKCGCLQIAEPVDDLARYYPDGYYSYRPVRRPGLLKGLVTRLRDRYVLTGKGLPGRLAAGCYPAPAPLQAMAALSLHLDARILDVGCGGGELLQTLHGLGFDRLQGADPFNTETIRIPDGPTIHKQDIHEVEGEWDVVMFHHSLEHVPDPARVLASAARLLAPGGRCLVRTPIVPSVAWEKYGPDWVQLDAPRHLFLFSLESLRLLAADASFEVVDVAYDSTAFQFWGSEQYARDIPLSDARSHGRNPGGSIFTVEQAEEFERLAAQANAAGRGDQAAVILKKKGLA